MRVRVHAATVCPDWRLRKATPIRFVNGPWGRRRSGPRDGFAGTVIVGKAVARFAAGDEVFGSAGFQFGSHAEICVPVGSLTPSRST